MNRSKKRSAESMEALLARLSLTAASREVSRVLSESESVSHGEFLQRVLELELSAREERRRERTLDRARLRGARGLAELDFSARKELSPTLLTELGTCRFVEERRNVVLLGPSGTGKTTIAEALALSAALEGYSVHRVDADPMLNDMRASEEDGSTRRISRRYLRPRLLVIDEVWPRESWQGEFLYRVVRARHRHGSTILVSNVRVEDWRAGFKLESMAVATLDRLLDNATVLRFSGPSVRKPREICDIHTDGNAKQSS